LDLSGNSKRKSEGQSKVQRITSPIRRHDRVWLVASVPGTKTPRPRPVQHKRCKHKPARSERGRRSSQRLSRPPRATLSDNDRLIRPRMLQLYGDILTRYIEMTTSTDPLTTR